jgi:hypothetical protein
MAAATRPANRPPGREIDEQTDLGDVYMRSLLRSQLRLGLAVLAVVGGVLGSLPVVFALEPRLADIRVLGVPLPWLLVGVAVYPLMLAAAWWLVRGAERNERDFTQIVERS